MQIIRNSIPNFITLLNLLSGCFGIIILMEGNPQLAPYFVFLAAFLDFGDGLAARLLNAKTEIGKQLDSLADLISFGLLPAFIVYQMIVVSLQDFFTEVLLRDGMNIFLESLAFLIVVFSALRLAKFNVDDSQEESFKGLPTPANAILIASLPLVVMKDLDISMFKLAGSQFLSGDLMRLGFSNIEKIVFDYFLSPGFLCSMSVILSLLLVSNIPMFSLKIKSFSWKGNELRFGFIGFSTIVYIFFAVVYNYYFIPLTIILILYLLVSILKFLISKKSTTNK